MNARPWVLGLSCSHNGSACLLHGDEIVVAIQEERLLRAKRYWGDPKHSTYFIVYCLQAAGIRARDLDMIVYSRVHGDDPGTEGDIYLNEALDLSTSRAPVVSLPHHYAHAVSAFAISGQGSAAVLVTDGAGSHYDRLPPDERASVVGDSVAPDDWEWLSHYEANGTRLSAIHKQVTKRMTPSHFGSLGDMYASVGRYLFGDFHEGPGKVMGLAPYGEPAFAVDRWLAVGCDGIVRVNPQALHEIVKDGFDRDDFQSRANLAASVQKAIEYALLEIVRAVRRRSGGSVLCYAGGVALNSVANEIIVRDGGFQEVFICPAAEDSGPAIGAAYHGLWALTGENTRRVLRRDAVGRTYSQKEVDAAIEATPAFHVCTPTDSASHVARLLRDGKIIGWFDGRSELGPRALGQRSILCDPRRADGKDVLNSRVKHREAFRPYAPVILREHAETWFDIPADRADSPFMLRVWQFRRDMAARVPAVSHVDNSARVQTITRETHPSLYRVIEAFHAETGVPILLNTSFNIAGEPIVETPEDALWCLLRTGLDCCVFGERIVHKREGFDPILSCPLAATPTLITVCMPNRSGEILSWPASPLDALPMQFQLAPVMTTSLFDALNLHIDKGNVSRPVAYATLRTRWGEHCVLLGHDQHQVLAHIDGKRSGREMLDSMPGWTEDRLAQTIGRLGAKGLVSLLTPAP
jgi:carbamoyltransferase